MLEPIGDQEGVVFVEVAVVENEKKFAAVRVEPLNGMRDARREIPQIADPHVVDEISPLGIDGGDARSAVKHVGPFSLLVPVELADAAGVEAHLHTGDTRGNAEFASRHLTGPSTRRQSHVSIGEREAQVWQRAIIGGRRHKEVGVLPIPRDIAGTGIGAAMAGPLRLRERFIGLRACRRCRCKQASGSGRHQHVTTRDGIHDVPLTMCCRAAHQELGVIGPSRTQRRKCLTKPATAVLPLLRFRRACGNRSECGR